MNGSTPGCAGSVAARRRVTTVAVAVACLAVLIRLPHLDWGLPQIEEEALPLKKAFAMWGWNEGRLQLDPRTAGWPSLSFYVHLLLQHLVYWIGRAGGVFADRLDFYLLQRDLTPLVLAGRALGVAAAGMVAALGVKLGQRLAGGAWGLFAGLLAGGALAVNSLLYAESRLITPDILLTLLAALAVVRLVDIREQGRLRDYVWAGIWIGLGTSAKYSPILLVPALYAIHLLRRRAEAAAAPDNRPPGDWLAALGLGDRRLYAAALACALAFVATSPFLLLDLTVFKRDFLVQIMHLSEGHFGHEDRGWRSLYYLRHVLGPAFGWPGLLTAAAGLLWAAVRRRGLWLVPAICLLCLALGLGLLSTQFDRYMLPLLLPLGLGIAAAAAWLAERLRARSRPANLIAAALLALLVLAPAARTTAVIGRTQAAPSTLEQARQYIMDELAEPGLIFAMESYSPQLPLGSRSELAAQEAFARLSADQQRKLLGDRSFEVLFIPLYTMNVELAAFYYDARHYLPLDIIVTSGAVRERYERWPERFQRQNAFYRDLDRHAQLLRVFEPGPRAAGPEIRIYRPTPAGREQLLRERGPLTGDFYREFCPQLHKPHFHAFLAQLARHAYDRQQYALADLYYRALHETTPPDQVAAFLSQYVMAKLMTGQADAARELCETALRRDPQDLQALTLLGMALEDLGDHDGALAAYERCLVLDQRQARQAAPRAADAAFDGPAWARRLWEDLRRRLAEQGRPR